MRKPFPLKEIGPTVCPDTGNIPDRLLLSRACFRLFPAEQIYSYFALKDKKILYKPMWISVWSKMKIRILKEKKNQKKKEKVWASPMNLFD